jgi:hypothetical protein
MFPNVADFTPQGLPVGPVAQGPPQAAEDADAKRDYDDQPGNALWQGRLTGCGGRTPACFG